MRFRKPIRLARSAYEDATQAFHITMNARPGTVPFRGDAGARVWELVLNERTRGNITILAACLMPDHLHVVCQPGSRDIVAWANGFKSYSTRVAREGGQPSATWQPSFFDRRIKGEAQLRQTIAYVSDNPAAAGLVREPGAWPWAFVADEFRVAGDGRASGRSVLS
jgi:REP element-mobilizing transposase RayT